MSGPLPHSLEGGHAPNTLELLWERNRRLVQGLFWLLFAGLVSYYGLQYYEQSKLNARWSQFAAASFLHDTYSPAKVDDQSGSIAADSVAKLLDDLRDTPGEKFDQAIAAAAPAQVPYLLWLQANHAAKTGDMAKAMLIADQMKERFSEHPLVKTSDYPVQVRDPVKKDPAEEKNDKTKPKDKEEPELQPAKSGSLVGELVGRLKAAKDYVAPPQFQKPEVPADAQRYRITFEGDYGDCVIATMIGAAPKHCAKFQEIVDEKFWDGIKVDEIVRPGKSRWSEQVWQIHFGFESTRTEANSTDWDITSASKDGHVVEEMSPLGHFAGAVAARSRDGKSEVDRLYICSSDCTSQDDSRQVFAYVVEGLENVKRVCEAGFARSEDEDTGRGRPAENIAIKSVVKL